MPSLGIYFLFLSNDILIQHFPAFKKKKNFVTFQTVILDPFDYQYKLIGNKLLNAIGRKVLPICRLDKKKDDDDKLQLRESISCAFPENCHKNLSRKKPIPDPRACEDYVRAFLSKLPGSSNHGVN